VPIDHYPVATGRAVEVFGQLGLDLEDIDLNHDYNLAQKSVSRNAKNKRRVEWNLLPAATAFFVRSLQQT
jgi:hypothetical protein